jgi:hypothetical protein
VKPRAFIAAPTSSIRWRLFSQERAMREPVHAWSSPVFARQTDRLFLPMWISSDCRRNAWTYRTVIPVTWRKMGGRRRKRNARKRSTHRVDSVSHRTAAVEERTRRRNVAEDKSPSRVNPTTFGKR